MLSEKKKIELKKVSAKILPTIIIGKDGLNDNILENIYSDLLAHELVKISVLKTCDENIRSLSLDIAGQMQAEIIQVIGRVIVIYKESKKHIY